MNIPACIYVQIFGYEWPLVLDKKNELRDT